MSRKISTMPSAQTLSGEELLEIVQDGQSRKVPIGDIGTLTQYGKSAYEIAIDAPVNAKIGDVLDILITHPSTGPITVNRDA